MNKFLLLCLLSAIAANALALDEMKLRGDETAAIDSPVHLVEVADRAKLTLRRGAKVHLLLGRGDAHVVIEEGARVFQLWMGGRSVLRANGGVLSNLSLNGNARAQLHRVLFEGGSPDPGWGANGIVFTPGAEVHLHADLLAYDAGIVQGIWSGGEKFRMSLTEQESDDKEVYERPGAMPAQLVIHELPGPGFDCGKAASRVERTICDDPELARMDKELAKVFAQVMATAEDPPARRREQRRWLAERDRCSERACLVAAYSGRLQAIAQSGAMTDARAQAICGEVVKAVNDGSIGARFLKFGEYDPEASSRWSASHTEAYRTLSGELTLNHKGRTRRFGMLDERGSCSSCTVVDLEAKKTELYPPDDEKERLRWAGWGECGHVLMVQGEPIEVTGNFRSGFSEASLVAWIAPDGAKRALCHLQDTGRLHATLSEAGNANLCNAVHAGGVEAVSWDDASSIEGGTGPAGLLWEKAEFAQLDLDMDGEKEAIGRFEYDSGAGCGGKLQWLAVLEKIEEPAATAGDLVAEPQRLGEGFAATVQGSTLDEPGPAPIRYRVAETALSEALKEHSREWLRRSEPNDARFAKKFFEYGGKTYLLSDAESLSGRVRSFWGGEVRTWCEFALLPQHQVEVYYPIETWPVRGP